MIDELGRKIITKLVGLKAKTYTYLKDSNDEEKKAKRTESVSSKKLKFEDYKKCLEAAQIENKINHLEKNKINKDVLKYYH